MQPSAEMVKLFGFITHLVIILSEEMVRVWDLTTFLRRHLCEECDGDSAGAFLSQEEVGVPNPWAPRSGRLGKSDASYLWEQK